MDVANRVRSESNEASGRPRSGSKGTIASLSDVVEVLQDLSHRYDQEVQELRATVAKLTAENRKLMRRTSDSDGSTTATNTWTSSAPSSSIQDSNSPKPTSKITSFIAEEPDKPDYEDDPSPDPLVDVEVLEEITPLEYEARRRAANSDENLPDTNFQRGTSYVGFKLKDLWTSEVLSKARTPQAASIPPPSTTSTALRLRPTVAVNAAAMGMAELYQGWVSRFIARPGDRKRLVWDCCGLLFIVYDCIAIPINVFDPPVSTFTIFMDWLTLVFWTLNIGATLTTGFVKEGLEVLSPKEIMKNYLRTWFIIDVLTLGPDWTLEIVARTAPSDGGEGSWGDSAGSQSVRLLRVLRFVRIARLLRLLKLKLLLEAIGDALPMSDYATIVARVAQMVAVLLYLNHVIACIFFATSSLVSGQNTWTAEYGLLTRPWTDQYAVALHWSLTQFTPASMDVQPQNSVERCFAISVVIFALVGFSYVVGDISSCLTQLRNMSETSSKEFRKLRNFMRMHKVPRLLALRVTKFAEHAYSKQREAMPMSKVTLLNLISEQLLGELTFAMNKPHLVVHPLFETMELNATLFLQRMCIKALAPKQLAHNDFLFVAGEQAKAMTFLTSGMLLYKKVLSANSHEEYVQIDCDWITEQALWLSSWEHLGTAESLGESTLVSIDSEAFASVVEQSSTALVRLMQLYARQFIGWLNELPMAQLSDVVQGDVMGEKIRGFIPENLARSTS